MEGLTVRFWILGSLLLVGGLAVAKMPPAARKAYDENRMEELAPDTVAGCTYVRGHEDPEQSYRMDETTYKALDPSGIVTRLYEVKGKVFDVVLIASDNSKSFHDPRVCFTASGWEITGEKAITLDTKKRGSVPMTFVTMNGGGMERNALYGYKSPKRFLANTRDLRWDLFVGKVINLDNEPGVFYRFIPQTNGTSEKELLQFASTYLDDAFESSGGFF